MPNAAENVKKFTLISFNEKKGDLVGRTNLTNFRASECRAELVRAMPSAAENLEANIRASENIELVKIRATYKVAII